MDHPLFQAVVAGDAKGARSIVDQALAADTDPLGLIDRHLIPAMAEVGRRFESNEYFVPELMLAARAMKSAMEPLRPLLAGSGREPIGRVVIGTVQGDLHDIGKNLVAAMLEGGGFAVTDLGVNVTPDKFVAAIREEGANLVGLSALLTTTMMNMKTTVEAISEAGLRGQIKILIGGAPITPEFAQQIGADGYGANAAEAVAVFKKALEARS